MALSKIDAAVVGQPIRLAEAIRYLAMGALGGAFVVTWNDTGSEYQAYSDGKPLREADRPSLAELERLASLERWAQEKIVEALRVTKLRSYVMAPTGEVWVLPATSWLRVPPENLGRVGAEGAFEAEDAVGTIVLREAEFLPWATAERTSLPSPKDQRDKAQKAGRKPGSGRRKPNWFKYYKPLHIEHARRRGRLLAEGKMVDEWPTDEEFAEAVRKASGDQTVTAKDIGYHRRETLDPMHGRE